MIYRRLFSDENFGSISNKRYGSILVDILLAVALATAFVSSMTIATVGARDNFDRARSVSGLLAVYDEHASEFNGLMPHESKTGSYSNATNSPPVMIEARGNWYGNDRIETDISVSYDFGTSSPSTSSLPFFPKLSFTSIRAYPYGQSSLAMGTPLCSPDLKFSTTTSVAITPITLPINPLLPLTDLEIRDGIAYISADSSKAADPSIFIADIRDPKNPIILSSIHTGPGLASIALAGKYVFAAALSTAAQLHVIRMDSLNSISLAKKYPLPTPEASTTRPLASSIYFYGNKIYLGTEKWDGEEFSVIDVSVPESPVKIGGFETGSKINDIVVRDNTTYLAASDFNQLWKIDISDKSYPHLIESFSPSGWQRQEGKAVNLFEDSLNFGRTAGGFDIATDHELFTWPEATSSIYKSMNISGGIYGLAVDQNHIFAATRTSGRELAIFELSLSSSTAAYYSLPVAPQSMTCDDNKLYILAHTAPVIYEIKFSQ